MAPKSFLARMVDRLPRVSQPPHANDYLALLDRALVDRFLSTSEQDALLETAGALGLTLADTMELHRAYLVALATAAWQDKVISDDERKDLLNVADLLGLARDEVDIALCGAQNSPAAGPALGKFCLKTGDLVVFTGQMNLPREDWQRRAVDAGLQVSERSITRSTRLLVAADPDSQSGKAAKARRYGIPIVTEEAFASLLNRLEVSR